MFNLSVGPFPKAPNMTFAALQTYSDGSTVNWDEKAPNGAVPDHPAPVAARTVTATLSSAQVAALHLTLRRLTPDGSQWATSAAVVPLPGVWTLTLDVALGPAGAYSTSASYRVW